MLGLGMSAWSPDLSTPLVRLSRFAPHSKVFAKAEHLLVTGSIFDRIAGPMIQARRTEIAERGAVVFAGSGSACLAFAGAIASMGVKAVAVTSEGALPEHRQLLSMHRLERLSSSASRGLAGTHEVAEKIARERSAVLLYTPLAEQDAERAFSDHLCARAFEWLRLAAPATLVVPLVSVALLKSLAAVLAVLEQDVSSEDPEPGLVASRGVELIATVSSVGALGLQDDVFSEGDAPTIEGVRQVAVSDADAGRTRADLARTEGLLVGLSSSSALFLARETNREGSAVALTIDAGDRYFSVDRRLERAGSAV